jgi:hypothetical protein
VQARTALIAAIICGSLAIGVVALDVVWSLEATVEAQVDGQWQSIASTHPHDMYSPRAHPFMGFCHGPDFRLVIDNNRPISADVDVHVTYHNATSKRTETAINERVSLDRFSDTNFLFTIPDAAFPEPTDANRTDPWAQTTSIDIRVGPHQLWVNACKEVTP